MTGSLRTSPRTVPPPAPGRRVPWTGAAALVCGVPAVLLTVLVGVGWPPLLEGDASVARSLHDAAHDRPGWTQAARILTDWVWDPATMRLLLGGVAVAVWWRGRRRLALWLLGSMALGAAVQNAAKYLVGRERPRWEEPLDSAHLAALPSGHAMTAALVCGLLVWVVRGWSRRWLVVAAGAVSVAGVSATRVFLGVHWLTDVVVGVLLGCALAAGTAWRWEARRRPGGEGG